MDDELGYTPDKKEPVGPVFAIPVPKVIGDIDVSTAQPSPLVTVLDDAQVKPDYKTLRSRNAKAAIKAVELLADMVKHEDNLESSEAAKAIDVISKMIAGAKGSK